MNVINQLTILWLLKNIDNEIDKVNRGSDIEIDGDSSEESDDNTVHQNVNYLSTVSNREEFVFRMKLLSSVNL